MLPRREAAKKWGCKLKRMMRNGLLFMVIAALISMMLILSPPVARAQGDFEWTRQASGTNLGLLGVSALDQNHAWTSGW